MHFKKFPTLQSSILGGNEVLKRLIHSCSTSLAYYISQVENGSWVSVKRQNPLFHLGEWRLGFAVFHAPLCLWCI